MAYSEYFLVAYCYTKKFCIYLYKRTIQLNPPSMIKQDQEIVSTVILKLLLIQNDNNNNNNNKQLPATSESMSTKYRLTAQRTKPTQERCE